MNMGKEDVHPRDRANFVSRVTLWWIFGLLWKGHSRPLEHEDLYSVSDVDRAELLTKRLQQKWENEKTHARKNRRSPKFWKAVFHFFSWTDYRFFLLSGGLNLLARNIAWFLLIKLLARVSNRWNNDISFREGLVFVWGIIMCLVTKSISMHHFHYHGPILGIRARAAMVGLLYKKVLCVSKMLIIPGQVMELVANDSQRLVIYGEWFIQDALSTILYSINGFGWLYYFVGWQVIPGCLLLILFGLYRLSTAIVDHKLRTNASHFADERLGYLREIFSSIRTIKLNCFEKIFEEKILRTRRKEMKCKTMRWLIMATCYSFSVFGKQLVTFTTIVLMMFTDYSNISYESVFALLLLNDEVTRGLALNASQSIRYCVDGYKALQRIQAFLEIYEPRRNSKKRYPGEFQRENSEDVFEQCKVNAKACDGKDMAKKQERQVDHAVKNGHRLKPFLTLHDMTCKLPFQDTSSPHSVSNNPPLLYHVSIDINKPCLVGIGGPVGSGKSSLLSCVLRGELLITSGTVNHSGKLGYVSDTPWVFPGTIRENILFELDYNEEQYEQTIKACQLETDLQGFPQGDLSRIGEHSDTLSGGQRTRISLARAVYSQADIYLLDDPLSSLDAKVAERVFRDCIRGVLADRIVLLTTNNVSFLSEADHIVTLRQGLIVSKIDSQEGTPDDRYSTKEQAMTEEEPTKSEPKAEILQEQRENRITGNVSCKVYVEYFMASAPVIVLLTVLFIYIAGQVMIVLVDIKVSHLPKSTNGKLNSNHHVLTNYSLLFAVTAFFVTLSSICLVLVPTHGAYVVHNKMVACLLKAPLSFYATNPVGRIMNRFSQDVNNLDELLPSFLVACALLAPPILSALVLASIETYFVIPFCAVVLIFLFLMARFFIKSAMDLKRLVAIAGSPLYSHFSNTMAGARTIRVYSKQKEFERRAYSHIDEHSKAFLAYYTSVRWFSITVDIAGGIIVAIIIVAVLLSRIESSKSDVTALSILYATSIIMIAQYATRMFAETHALMTSAERALAYTKIKSEKGRDRERQPPETWPRNGKIHFKNVSLQHYKDGPRTLKNLTFEIKPREKIGIAGRTGAGKSSLVAALMQLAESDGEICIDGINIMKLNVLSTRRKISVISQDPVLISGSLKANLDPAKVFKDSELWDALEQMQMKSVISCLPKQLNSEIVVPSTGFSIGEKQLLHMTRILLEKSKIIVFDEATGKVDQKTDELIQEIVPKIFQDCTVITIAHRLDTILNCDRIMVMDHGKIIEFDKPAVLLNKEDGLLRQLYHISNGD